MLAGLLIVAALAADASGWSPSAALTNPYFLVDPGQTITGAWPNTDHSGHTPVACGPMAARTQVIVEIGQSLSANSVPGTYTQTQTGGDQLNVYDGGCYKTKTPLIGPNGIVPNWAQWLSDKLLAHGYADRVILVPIAVGGSSIEQWATDGAPMYLRDRIRITGRRLSDAGLTCTAIIWGQGESDVAANTSQADYAARLQTIIAQFQTSMPGCPFFVNLESYYPVNTAAGVAIRAAQSSVINGTTVLLGADFDAIPTSERFDGLHLGPTGANHAANLAEAALVAGLHL